jgi:hypothetical protein
MTRSNLPTIRKLRDSSSEDDERELSIMTKSQELNVSKVTNMNYFNLTSTLEDEIIFCSTNEDEEDEENELNQAVIYSSQDKLINDIKKWNRLRKLNNREPVYYCITQLEHVLNNVLHIIERMNN